MRRRPHRKPDKPVRRALDNWYLPVFITLAYAALTPGIGPATRATVTAALVVAYILGGIGQIICIWAQRLSQLRWQPAADNDHRLRVLTGQATFSVRGRPAGRRSVVTQLAPVIHGAVG